PYRRSRAPLERDGERLTHHPLCEACARLLSGSSEHHAERAPDEVEIEAERPVFDVLQIQLHPVIERDLVTPGRDLPEAGEPGTDRKASVLPGLVPRDFAGKRRARPDEAHVAEQDVDDLRQLVEGVLADEPSDRRDAWIELHLENRPVRFVPDLHP